MEFCQDCNFLLDNIIKDKHLIKFCKNCGFESKCESSCISSRSFGKSKTTDNIYESIKAFRIYDNRVQHTIHHPCANVNCPTIKNPKLTEAITYNESNGHERIYRCITCLTRWTYT
jgi:DNA-directed RNA polymerase subunit M/transcription elongation factor TFIIS